ncbi:hypothetical protein KKC44_01415 [Patescibacteria group bacterium]|nr:hypothetical protein [Patescibacteria group bacterium]MBU2259241.1 hypothetical protein [Patescibacteria group bacterium]
MALDDILAAITAQADHQIKETRSIHQKNLTKIREQGERTVATKKQEIAAQKEQRKAQLTAKTQNAAAMLKRNALLNKKQELLNKTYDNVIEELGKLPHDKIDPLIRACLKSIRDEGTVHPAKEHEGLVKKLADASRFHLGEPVKAKGGFIFVSKTKERDCTFEHLVSEILRPMSELEISQLLFSDQ